MQVVGILCNRCARSYSLAMDTPARLECSTCGGDILTPDAPLVLCDSETGEELGTAEAGIPFQAYAMRLPKTMILRSINPPPKGESEEESEVDNLPTPEADGQSTTDAEERPIKKTRRKRAV